MVNNFAFGGEKAQAELLKAEGVIVVEGRVDLTRYQLDGGLPH